MNQQTFDRRTQADVSCSAHVFKKKAETPSGAAALLMFTLLKSLVTSLGLILGTQPSVVMVLMTPSR